MVFYHPSGGLIDQEPTIASGGLRNPSRQSVHEESPTNPRQPRLGIGEKLHIGGRQVHEGPQHRRANSSAHIRREDPLLKVLGSGGNPRTLDISWLVGLKRVLLSD